MNQEIIPIGEAERPLFAGVDVGGTSIKIGLVDDLGRTLAFTSIPTYEERGPQDAVERVAETIGEVCSNLKLVRDDLQAIGLGTPGTMDIPAGMIVTPPNLPHWRHFPIRDQLSSASGRPVSFTNDANAAAYGEYWIGSGRDYRSMIMLTLGTGVGGGIIVEGMSIEGEHSFGSECGHIIVDSNEDARLCVWGGGRGELEAYASASAVVQWTEQLLAEGRESSVRARVEAGEELTTLMLYEEAQAGDELAHFVILETARYLGIGVVTLVHTIDPGAVILGGAMNFGGHNTDLGRQFLDRVRQEYKQRAFDVVQDVVIDFASLGGDAGYIGAAGIAREACRRA